MKHSNTLKIASYAEQLALADAQLVGIYSSFAAAPAAEHASENPYAALALIDANFAAFSADYADAIAVLRASIADLKAAKQAITAAKSAANADAAALSAAADAALARAEHTAKFAANVAEREQKIIAVQAQIAEAAGVATAGKSPAQVGEQLAAAVAGALGIAREEVGKIAANAEHTGAAAAKLAKSLSLGAAAEAIALTAREEAAKLDDAGAAAAKAAAVLAKQAALAVVAAKAAKPGSKGAEALLAKAAAAEEQLRDSKALEAAQKAVAQGFARMKKAAEQAAQEKKALAAADERALEQAVKKAVAEAKKAAPVEAGAVEEPETTEEPEAVEKKPEIEEKEPEVETKPEVVEKEPEVTEEPKQPIEQPKEPETAEQPKKPETTEESKAPEVVEKKPETAKEPKPVEKEPEVAEEPKQPEAVEKEPETAENPEEPETAEEPKQPKPAEQEKEPETPAAQEPENVEEPKEPETTEEPEQPETPAVVEETYVMHYGDAKNYIGGEITFKNKAAYEVARKITSDKTIASLAAMGVIKIGEKTIKSATEVEWQLRDGSVVSLEFDSEHAVNAWIIKNLSDVASGKYLADVLVRKVGGDALDENGFIHHNNGVFNTSRMQLKDIAKFAGKASGEFVLQIDAKAQAEQTLAEALADNLDTGGKAEILYYPIGSHTYTVTKNEDNSYGFKDTDRNIKISKLNTQKTVGELANIGDSTTLAELETFISPGGEVKRGEKITIKSATEVDLLLDDGSAVRLEIGDAQEALAWRVGWLSEASGGYELAAAGVRKVGDIVLDKNGCIHHENGVFDANEARPKDIVNFTGKASGKFVLQIDAKEQAEQTLAEVLDITMDTGGKAQIAGSLQTIIKNEDGSYSFDDSWGPKKISKLNTSKTVSELVSAETIKDFYDLAAEGAEVKLGKISIKSIAEIDLQLGDGSTVALEIDAQAARVWDISDLNDWSKGDTLATAGVRKVGDIVLDKNGCIHHKNGLFDAKNARLEDIVKFTGKASGKFVLQIDPEAQAGQTLAEVLDAAMDIGVRAEIGSSAQTIIKNEDGSYSFDDSWGPKKISKLNTSKTVGELVKFGYLSTLAELGSFIAPGGEAKLGDKFTLKSATELDLQLDDGSTVRLEIDERRLEPWHKIKRLNDFSESADLVDAGVRKVGGFTIDDNGLIHHENWVFDARSAELKDIAKFTGKASGKIALQIDLETQADQVLAEALADHLEIRGEAKLVDWSVKWKTPTIIKNEDGSYSYAANFEQIKISKLNTSKTVSELANATTMKEFYDLAAEGAEIKLNAVSVKSATELELQLRDGSTVALEIGDAQANQVLMISHLNSRDTGYWLAEAGIRKVGGIVLDEKGCIHHKNGVFDAKWASLEDIARFTGEAGGSITYVGPEPSDEVVSQTLNADVLGLKTAAMDKTMADEVVISPAGAAGAGAEVPYQSSGAAIVPETEITALAGAPIATAGAPLATGTPDWLH